MYRHSPFRYLQPVFFSGLFDDPVLLIRIRPQRKSLLFDCGQIHHLAKRVLKSVGAVFVSHAHMDHFMGIDTLIRNVHVSPQTVEIYGPPGVAGKACHKFASYDWNLTESCWSSFRVHDIHPSHTESWFLPGPEGFPCLAQGRKDRAERAVYEDTCLSVEAEQCDHIIPSIIYRVDEKPAFSIDERKLEQAGLVRGGWLRQLKKRYFQGDEVDPLLVPLRDGGLLPVIDSRSFYSTVLREQRPASIGYMTDIGATDDNFAMVASLLNGVTLLVCECSFLAEEVEKARASHHLCTTDLNLLVERLRPQYVLPMHLSRTYVKRSCLLYEQLAFPPEVTLLRLPDHLAPRPLLMAEAFELPRINRKNAGGKTLTVPDQTGKVTEN